MTTEPTVEERAAQPYAAIRARVTMEELGRIVPPLWPEVFAWLGARGLAPAGPPFIRYLVIDMDAELEVEAAVPVAAAVAGDGRVRHGVLPAGRYASLVHTGPISELIDANARLLAWGEEQGLAWRRDGDAWGGRVEFSHTDPREEPDPAKWRTEVAILVADGPPR